MIEFTKWSGIMKVQPVIYKEMLTPLEHVIRSPSSVYPVAEFREQLARVDNGVNLDN